MGGSDMGSVGGSAGGKCEWEGSVSGREVCQWERSVSGREV